MWLHCQRSDNMRDMLAVNALSKLQNIYSVIYAAKRSDFTEFIYLYIFAILQRHTSNARSCYYTSQTSAMMLAPNCPNGSTRY